MELSNDFLQHYRSFESLMHLKGYNQPFAIGKFGEAKPVPSQHLSSLLKDYLWHAQQDAVTEDRFYLYTYAEYLSADDYKFCRFAVNFTAKSGFQVNGLVIESEFPKETQKLSLRNNHEIPGKNAVIGRFKRPRPWDRMMRGDFKYRKRW